MGAGEDADLAEGEAASGDVEAGEELAVGEFADDAVGGFAFGAVGDVEGGAAEERVGA